MAICCAISWERESHAPLTAAKYFSVYGASSSRWSVWTKPPITASWIAFGSVSESTTEAQAAALASAVGRAARADAA
jgi:hypothetical protein